MYCQDADIKKDVALWQVQQTKEVVANNSWESPLWAIKKALNSTVMNKNPVIINVSIVKVKEQEAS